MVSASDILLNTNQRGIRYHPIELLPDHNIRSCYVIEPQSLYLYSYDLLCGISDRLLRMAFLLLVESGRPWQESTAPLIHQSANLL